MIRFREARREDVPAVVGLLADDALGAAREGTDSAPYLAAFDAMQAEAGNILIVGEEAGRVVATYQITFISGLSLRASRRAQVESVRVAADLRGRGVGAAMMADAEARAGGGLPGDPAYLERRAHPRARLLRTHRLYPIAHWL